MLGLFKQLGVPLVFTAPASYSCLPVESIFGKIENQTIDVEPRKSQERKAGDDKRRKPTSVELVAEKIQPQLAHYTIQCIRQHYR
jgi:hypothetical protein